MNVTATWRDEKRLIIDTIMHGKWTWEEAAEATSHVSDLLDEVDHPVCMVVEFKTTNWVPNMAMANMTRLFKQYADHANLVGIVVIGAGRLVDSIFSTVRTVAGRSLPDVKVEFVESRDAASQLISDWLGSAAVE